MMLLLFLAEKWSRVLVVVHYGTRLTTAESNLHPHHVRPTWKISFESIFFSRSFMRRIRVCNFTADAPVIAFPRQLRFPERILPDSSRCAFVPIHQHSTIRHSALIPVHLESICEQHAHGNSCMAPSWIYTTIKLRFLVVISATPDVCDFACTALRCPLLCAPLKLAYKGSRTQEKSDIFL